MRGRVIFTTALAAVVVSAALIWRASGLTPPPVRPQATPPVSSLTTTQPTAETLTTNKARRLLAPDLQNAAAYIPAQCYAETRDARGGTHNGCFVCHQASRAPNYVNDADVQTQLSFAHYATKNRWTNLQQPPKPAVIADDALLDWVRVSNYFSADGSITPKALDGYHPDCFFHFDAAGFDSAPDGRRTGWRAYAALPTPGMFMPTNGSIGDTLIRLPEPYRQDADGKESEAIYRINLAIVEAYVNRRQVPIASVDERLLGSDLDGDGNLGSASSVGFVWPPKPGRPFHYVGKAAELDSKQEGWPVAGLFPRGTELLHSLRYFDVVAGGVKPAARMKELRYMRKLRYLDYGQLDQGAQAEAREKRKSPDKLKHVFADRERGVTTGVGWLMQGFIENAAGELRPQNVEETTACIGCHGGVGATTDASFSFARKLGPEAFQGGWFHNSQRDLAGVPEPQRADGSGEYAHYLREQRAGDDFRSNDEVQKKFFKANGNLEPAQLAELARDVSVLLMPSSKRALALNRAYLGLVRAQHFEGGRDVSVGVAPKLRAEVAQDEATGIEVAVAPGWQSEPRR